MKQEKILIGGGEAIAYAVMQIDPEVVSAYPITPQTPIIETYAKYVSDGKVKTEMVLAESEHSALSACLGASAFGARTFTATSSQGLLYMNEIIYHFSGMQLPMVMAVGNRAIGAPINIHCDHSDSFTIKDAGWINIYCEDVQEAYDSIIIAQKLTEKTNIPVMVMLDGFFTTHSLQSIFVLDKGNVQKFIGEKPKINSLSNSKITLGEFLLPDSYYETRYQLSKALDDSESIIENIQKDYFDLSGRQYKLYDSYNTKDAEIVFVVLNSSAQLLKEACDEFRKLGKKVGVLRPRFLRPFPYKKLKEELKDKIIVVLDRNGKFGAEYSTLASEFKGFGKELYNVIYGLGGREFTLSDAKNIIELYVNKKQKEKVFYYGLRKELVESESDSND